MEGLWKIQLCVVWHYEGVLWKYLCTSIRSYIGTHIGYRCIEYECAMKDLRWIVNVLGVNMEDLWKIQVCVVWHYEDVLWKYLCKSIRSYIGTHIGYKCTEYECAMKDLRRIGDILGVNMEDLWKIHVFVVWHYEGVLWKYPCTSIRSYIGTHIGYKCIEYECAMKDLRWIGNVLGVNSDDLWKILHEWFNQHFIIRTFVKGEQLTLYSWHDDIACE